MNTNGNTACFVSPLNHSEADPKTVKANMKKVSIAQVEGSWIKRKNQGFGAMHIKEIKN